jgi:hypothetical protein
MHKAGEASCSRSGRRAAKYLLSRFAPEFGRAESTQPEPGINSRPAVAGYSIHNPEPQDISEEALISGLIYIICKLYYI